MNTLGARGDFLAAHEEVIGITVGRDRELLRGCGWVGRSRDVGEGGHGVEGTDGERELVEDVEVCSAMSIRHPEKVASQFCHTCVVFLIDESTQALLRWRTFEQG